jgi:hypothetical protein
LQIPKQQLKEKRNFVAGILRMIHINPQDAADLAKHLDYYENQVSSLTKDLKQALETIQALKAHNSLLQDHVALLRTNQEKPCSQGLFQSQETEAFAGFNYSFSSSYSSQERQPSQGLFHSQSVVHSQETNTSKGLFYSKRVVHSQEMCTSKDSPQETRTSKDSLERAAFVQSQDRFQLEKKNKKRKKDALISSACDIEVSIDSPTMTADEVLELAKKIKSLYDLCSWEFISSDVQDEFWKTLWNQEVFARTYGTKKRTPNPAGRGWHVMRILGYLNSLTERNYHSKPDRVWVWSCYQQFSKAYMLLRVIGKKRTLPENIKTIITTLPSPNLEIQARRLMSELDLKTREKIQKNFKDFSAKSFISNILPLMASTSILDECQDNTVKQVEVLAGHLKTFILEDKIKVSMVRD